MGCMSPRPSAGAFLLVSPVAAVGVDVVAGDETVAGFADDGDDSSVSPGEKSQFVPERSVREKRLPWDRSACSPLADSLSGSA